MVSLPTARFVQDIPRGGRALTRFFRTTNFLPGHVFPHKMSQLLTYFVRLVLFRSGPQDAPASEQYLIATGVLVAVSYALTNNLYDSVYHRVVIAVSQVIVFGAVVWVVLRLRNLQARWTQTLTALFGAAALFQFATWPVVELASSGEPSSMGLPQPLWFHIATGAWYLAVMSHVLRHALDTTIARGVAAAVFCQLSTIIGLILVLSVLGVTEPTAS